ncbi:MAG: rhomboid family intramembrane serine protease [Flavobacteriales bacterium]
MRDELRAQWRHGGAVKRLLLVNIGVFLLVTLVGLAGWLFGRNDLDDRLLPYLMASGDPIWLLHRPWTVVTYMFTHQAVMHLFWNMLMFWFSGQLFQGLLGDKRLVGNYLLGGLSGFAFYLLGGFLPAHLGLASAYPILGASAAVMAIFVGIATYQPNIEVNLFFLFTVRLKYVALVVVLLDLVGVRAGDNTGGHMAHLGGALYGFLAAKQLMQGRDWSGNFIEGLERIGDLIRGRKRARLKVAKGPARRTVRVVHDIDYNAAKRDKQERVDAILDKISRSGYDSLSKDERDFLFHASHEQ